MQHLLALYKYLNHLLHSPRPGLQRAHRAHLLHPAQPVLPQELPHRGRLDRQGVGRGLQGVANTVDQTRTHPGKRVQLRLGVLFNTGEAVQLYLVVLFHACVM